MEDHEIAAAVSGLAPSAMLGDQSLYAEALLVTAGLDPAAVLAWAEAQGGGAIEAGAMKLRKGQQPHEGTMGRPERFIAVPRRAR